MRIPVSAERVAVSVPPSAATLYCCEFHLPHFQTSDMNRHLAIHLEVSRGFGVEKQPGRHLVRSDRRSTSQRTVGSCLVPRECRLP